MPCKDISEVLQLSFDADDRLVCYALNKRTCGAEIGRASLLLPLVAGRSPDELLGLTGEDVLSTFRVAEAEEFLFFKHLVALQEGVAMLVGATPAGPEAACTALSVAASSNGGIELEALIHVSALAGKIKACGQCGRCGAKRPRRAEHAREGV